jgi:lysophospholipase L1-like esterase
MVTKSSLVNGKSLSWTKVISFSLLPVILILFLAEGGLRAYALYFRTVYEQYNSVKERLELVPNYQAILPDGRVARVNSKGFVGPEFTDMKAPGVFRIFTLGDSCTFGDWDISYAAYLGEKLNSASQSYEVINAGIEGYNSEYALGRLQEDILKYQPDLVTIYIGWNDLMKTSPGNISSSGRVTWLGKVFNHSYLYKGLGKIIFFYIRPLLSVPVLKGDESEYHIFDQFIPATYEDNVSAMIALLKERNVSVLLLTRPIVLSRDMTAEDLRRQHVFFPFFPEAYSVPRLLSLHNAYNNSLRRLAARFDLALIDLDENFNQRDKRLLFWDTMHPSKEGHELIASILFPVVHIIALNSQSSASP